MAAGRGFLVAMGDSSAGAIVRRIQALEERLDAGRRAVAKADPRQMGLDLFGGGGGTGKACGESFISAGKDCHKGGGAAGPPPRRSPPQLPPAGLSAGPMTINNGGDSEFDAAAEKKKAAGGLRYFRSNRGGTPVYAYHFRDKQAAAHWYADQNAKSDADQEIGSDQRRSKEWRLEYQASYAGHRNLLRDIGDWNMLQTIQAFAGAGKASRGGTATDVRIGGNSYSRPLREEAPAAAPEPVLTNPGREDPGMPPRRFGAKPKPRKPEEEMITSQQVLSGAEQLKFAKQQRAAAWRAGDKKGEAAWAAEQAEIQRRRLAAAREKQALQQTALFGVTEYDDTMPLFARRDADPIGRMLEQVVAEQLPGARLLDWEQHGHGVTSGRAVADGLIYRVRADADSVGYRPGWDGIDEDGWAARSAGFLEVRLPGSRLDFKTPKFSQLKSKRKCTTGYSCGTTCISLQKECRITPKSAISKQRLQQLHALAKEGNPLADQQAQAVETARLQKAYELREQRNLGKLKKLMERPEVAEMVRTGKVPTAPAGEGQGDQGPKAGKVLTVSPNDIEVDPKRFQYKIKSNAQGEVGSLSGVKKWDDNLAGVISVWEDPKDGKTYVVNGHNRLGLARRLGAEQVTVRYLRAENATEARAIGAMQNIAEGAGTEMDAAKFFRDTGIKTEQEVEAKGLPLRSGQAAKGLALSKLPPEMFDQVVRGDLSTGRGAIIGGSGLSTAKQREIGKMLRQRKSISDGTLQEYVEHLAASESRKQTTLDIFGSSEETVDNGLIRADLAASLKRKLKSERRLFATVARSRAAQELEERAGNQINVERSADVANEADQVLRVFDQLKGTTGPVSAALNRAAERVQKGEPAAKVKAELQEEIVRAMEEELEAAGLRKKPNTEAPTMSMFDAADARLDALVARLDAKKCVKGTPCGNTCIPKGRQCKATGSPEGTKRLTELVKGEEDQPAKGQAAPAAPASPEREQGGGGGFRSIARAAGRALGQALARLLGRGGGAQAPEAAAAPAETVQTVREPQAPPAPAARETVQTVRSAQAKAAPKQGKAPSGDLGKWEWEEVSFDRDYVRRYETTLSSPVEVDGKQHKSIHFDITSDESTYGEKQKRLLSKAGFNPPEGGGTKAIELSFEVGVGEGSGDFSRIEFADPRVSRRVALEIAKRIKARIADMPDGTIVAAGYWKDDGAGAERRRLYEAAGFSFYEQDPEDTAPNGFAIVRGGKLHRFERGRQDSAGDAEIDLDAMILQLLQMGRKGKAPEGRTDAIEARLDSLSGFLGALGRGGQPFGLDPTLPAPGPEVLISGGQSRLGLRGGARIPHQRHGVGESAHSRGVRWDKATAGRKGKPCGDSFISAGYDCHKGESGQRSTTRDTNYPINAQTLGVSEEEAEDTRRQILFWSYEQHRKYQWAQIKRAQSQGLELDHYSRYELETEAMLRESIPTLREREVVSDEKLASFERVFNGSIPAYEGEIYRGMSFQPAYRGQNTPSFTSQELVAALIRSIEAGETVAHSTSWTPDPAVAMRFFANPKLPYDNVILKIRDNRLAVPVTDATYEKKEKEILMPPGVRMKVVSVTEKERGVDVYYAALKETRTLQQPYIEIEVQVQATQHTPGVRRQDQADVIEARIEALAERLDARRKVPQSPGQMSLFGEGTGKPCGESFISAGKECHKGGGGAPQSAGKAPPTREERVAEQERQIAEVRARRAEQDKRALAPNEIPITEGDIEGMERAREIMAGTRNPRAELEAWARAQAEQETAAKAKAEPPAEKRPFATPDELDSRLAMAAHAGTSFDPEKRGRQHQEEYAAHLNTLYQGLQKEISSPEQQATLDTEMAAYKQGFTARYKAWLSAKSRVVSPMIAGPSNFPVRRMEKRNESERRRFNELTEYQTKAQTAIRRKLQRGLPPEQARDQEFREYTRDFGRSIQTVKEIDAGRSPFSRSAFTTSIHGKLTRLAEKGDVELVTRLLDHLHAEQSVMRKPLFTPRHSIWDLRDTARSQRSKQEKAAAAQQQQGPEEFAHGQIERDFEGNRVRIYFQGKPDETTRTMLKRSGWKWSPTNGAWQRMNTENSVYSARQILRSLEADRKDSALDTVSNRIAALGQRLKIQPHQTAGSPASMGRGAA